MIGCLKEQVAIPNHNVGTICLVLSDVATVLHEYDAVPTVNCAFRTKLSKLVAIGIDSEGAPMNSDLPYLLDRKLVVLTINGAREAA